MDGGTNMLTRTEIRNIFEGKCERMMVFVRHLESCRETHYAPCWEAKSGNIVTRSVVSVDRALELHNAKLQRIGKQIREIVFR